MLKRTVAYPLALCLTLVGLTGCLQPSEPTEVGGVTAPVSELGTSSRTSERATPSTHAGDAGRHSDSAAPAGATVAPVVADEAGPERSGVVVVQRVIDGDTLVLVDGTRVRLLGIDTPEVGRNGQPDECGAAEATAALNALAGAGSAIRLELDEQAEDRFGRTLAWLWSGDTLLNETLASDGHARAMVIAPNSRYRDRILRAVDAARAQGRGIWGLCPNG
jgi:endonuclease YncB( thermonuclease family)